MYLLITPITSLARTVILNDEEGERISATMKFNIIKLYYIVLILLLLLGEGRSRKKSKAKEEAATQMIKEIIKRQMCNNLPIQIIPFSELQ